MNYTIIKEIDLLEESYMLLNKVMQKETTEDIFAHTVEKHNVPREVMETSFADIIKLYKNVNERIEEIEAEGRYFFKHSEGSDFSVASLLLDRYEFRGFKEQLVYLQAATQRERFEYIKGILIEKLIDNRRCSEEERDCIKCERDLIQTIHQTEHISLESKAMICYVYYNFESLLEQCIELLQKTSDMIKEDISRIKETLDERYKEIEEEIRTRKNILFTMVPIEEDATLEVKLSITAFNEMHMSSSKEKVYTLLIGRDIDKIEKIKELYKKENKDLTEFLRVIGDENKFKILNLLNDERLYASQLATKLGVSNPTISHHMNSLLSVNLVKIEREKNRYYYQLDKDVLKQYISSLQKTFK